MTLYIILIFSAICVGMAISVKAFGTGGKRKRIFQDIYFSIEEVDGIGVLYTKTGEYSAVLKMENPVQKYSANIEAYYEFTHLFAALAQTLGEGYALHKQDVFVRKAFKEENGGNHEFLSESYFRYFNGRPFTDSVCYLTITQENKKSRLMSFDNKKWRDFLVKIRKVHDQLRDAGVKSRFLGKTEQWPKNLNGREYNGMNAMMLLLHCEKEGYKIPRFCTFDRIQQFNKTGKKDEEQKPRVSVLKGEHSFPVMLTTFTVVNKETKEHIKWEDYKLLSQEEREKYNVYPKLQTYHVFNVAQTNLKEVRPEFWEKLEQEYSMPKVEKDEQFAFEPVDRMIADNRWICPIKPMFGDSAYFSISKNEIVMPEKRQFKDGESFYSNLFHEMGHSTGAEGQLDRIKPATFGSAEYAREELVAELTAALTAQRYGMTKHLKGDSAAYLKSWLDSLKESPQFIKTTLLDVKKATSMLTQHIDKIAMEIDQEKKAEQENGQGKSYLSIDDGDHAVLAYNGSAVYIQHHEKEDSVKIAVPTSNGLEVKLSVPYDHGKDLDTNYQEAFAQYKSLTEPSQSKENVYYASIAYLQSTDDTSELDKLKEKGDYQGLLTLAKEYYDGNGMDEEQTYRKPCQNRGDDLLIEDKDFAVVYNGSVGGTYEVFLKHTEQEVRDHITRYGIGRASEDVKAVAREMTAEEFSELAQRKMPIFQMPNGGLLNLQYNKDKDSLDVGTVTNAGLSVKHTFPFSHNHSMDANISSAYEQLLDMEEYQKEEVQEEHVAKSAFRR